MSLEQAYLSAVLVANGLSSMGRPEAAEALKLKEAIAKAVTHPETLREEPFVGLWAKRSSFAGLNLDGEWGAAVMKHARILQEINF